MPAGDRTGPMGLGPRTGKLQGFCQTGRNRDFAYNIRDRGFGRRSGIGGGIRFRNRCCWSYPGYVGSAYLPDLPTVGEEMDSLHHEIGYLESNLNQAKKRLDELKAREPASDQSGNG